MPLHCNRKPPPTTTLPSQSSQAKASQREGAGKQGGCSSNGGGPGVRGDRAPAGPARRRRRGRRRGDEERLWQEGLRRDHRPQAEAGAGGGRRRGRGEGGGGCRQQGGRGGRGVRAREDEAVAQPEQRRHRRRRAARPRREAPRPQGSGGGMAAGALVPEEHHVRAVREGRRQQGRRRRQALAGSRRRVREGEPGRRAVPAQGGPQDVQELPGAVQGARENVQLLHHWKLWVPRDERHEREQAGGSAQRLRVRADLRGQGRRLDARRRRPMGDVRRIVQAPSDHERIRSHWPGTKGHGEMQEQKLNAWAARCKNQVSIALQLCSSLYHTRPCSPSLNLLISEVILVCQLFYQFQ